MQFAGVLDANDSFFLVDERSERAEHGGLAGAGPAADDDVLSLGEGLGDQGEDHFGNGSGFDELGGGPGTAAEAADRESEALGNGRAGDGDTRAVRQAGIDDGGFLVGIETERPGDALYGGVEHPFSERFGARRLLGEDGIEAAFLLEPDGAGRIDHQLGDGGILEHFL